MSPLEYSASLIGIWTSPAHTEPVKQKDRLLTSLVQCVSPLYLRMKVVNSSLGNRQGPDQDGYLGMQEALQRLEAQADLRGKTGRANTTCNAERMSRIGSDPGAAERQLSSSRMKAFPSEGSPRSRAPNAPRTDSPSEALSGPSLIFNDSATSEDRCCRCTTNPVACNRTPASTAVCRASCTVSERCLGLVLQCGTMCTVCVLQDSCWVRTIFGRTLSLPVSVGLKWGTCGFRSLLRLQVKAAEPL